MKLNLDWNKFKLFYYVAKAGSFTAAGNDLNISQSAVSRSIQALEDQLNIKLFERLPRGLSLTRQGEVLLQAAEIALEQFSKAEMIMLEEEEEPQGDLTIATTMGLASVWMMPIIDGFLKLYPKIRLSVIGNDEELDLKTREADVSIRPLIKNHPELVQEHLFDFHYKLFASPAYLEAYGIPKDPKDLDKHKLIVFGYDALTPYSDINWSLKLGMPKGEIRKPYLCINAPAALKRAAEDGHGIVSLTSEYPGIYESDLVEILKEVEKPAIPIYYVYPESLKDSKRVNILGKYLKQRLKVDLPQKEKVEKAG